LKVNGIKLRYLDWGDRSLPILMLHGLRGYAETWQGVAEHLSSRFRPLALDQRGRGGSDWAPWQSYWAGQYVSDLESFVDQLDLDRFVLLGHSMGGTNAIVYAARHPDRVAALVIEDMGPGASSTSSGSSRIKGELGGTPETFAAWSEAEAYWRAQRPHASAEAVRSRLTYTLRELADGRIGWRYDLEGIRRARLDSSMQIDLWPYVTDLRCQTLVIRGAESDFLARAAAEEMARRNANLRWVEIEGASHYVHDDNLPAFNRALSQFLEGAG
jgi:pimeloyl-ACP methyl ester carboxylesterase